MPEYSIMEKANEISFFLKLASQANQNVLLDLTQNFPVGWNVIDSYKRPVYGTIPVRYLLTRSPQDPSSPTSPQILSMSFGVNWGRYFRDYSSELAHLEQVNLSIVDSATAQINSDIQEAYLNIRKKVWATIKKHLAKNDVLVIGGMGLGAAIAQIAALDLRVGHIVQGLERSQYLDYQPKCYSFSAPNFVNKAMSIKYNQSVVDREGNLACFNYRIDNPKANLKVDFFPLYPNSATQRYPLGEVLPTDKVSLPPSNIASGPWLERGDISYLDAFSEDPTIGPDIANQNIQRPAGYSPVYAHALTQLVSATYQYAQHPQSSPTLPSSYQAVPGGSVEIENWLWARLFTNANGDKIVAIRGTVSYQELESITSRTEQVTSKLVSGGWIAAGVRNFYYGMDEFKNQTSFRASLFKMLHEKNIESITLCGHDVGGALANLIALDIRSSTDLKITVKDVYTFGATGLGGALFSKSFNDLLKNNIFNVRRIYDQISKSLLLSQNTYYRLGMNVILDGQLPIEDSTYHSIDGYERLLDPRRSSQLNL